MIDAYLEDALRTWGYLMDDVEKEQARTFLYRIFTQMMYEGCVPANLMVLQSVLTRMVEDLKVMFKDDNAEDDD